jgi:hypothetical protein
LHYHHLSGLEIARQDTKLGEQGHGAGFANALGLAQVGEVLLVLSLWFDPLARRLGQPFDTLVQPRDSLGFILDQ